MSAIDACVDVAVVAGTAVVVALAVVGVVACVGLVVEAAGEVVKTVRYYWHYWRER